MELTYNIVETDFDPIESIVKVDPDDLYFYHGTDYTDLVATTGVEIVVSAILGFYQGDILYLVKHIDPLGKVLYGFTVVGYGSCSYCDWLEGAESIEEVDEIRRSIFQGIAWGTREQMIDYLQTKDWRTEFYYGKETEQAVQKMLEELAE